MQEICGALRREGKTIGFVPTMGFLHEGHMSLIKAAREKCDSLVVSIYVNPLQFSPSEDFAEYPRDLQRDLTLCEKEGVDFVFAPADGEMYPAGFETSIKLGRIASGLEGKFRPGHFDGVATIVAKLFNIVKPHVAFFGQKDFQQSLVVQRMIRDLNFDLEIVLCPIVRAKDGLALSSRNRYLSAEERKSALVLFRAIQLAREMVANGERRASEIEKRLSAFISAKGATKIDYVAVRSRAGLGAITDIEEGKAVLLLAVWIGKTRLIDNELL
jgi:pantoate--beta-alanine ligase